MTLIGVDRFQSMSSAALRWWFGELAALLPAPLRQIWSPGARLLTLIVDGDAVELIPPSSARNIRPMRLAGPLPPAWQSLLHQAQRGALHVALRLPERCGLQGRMILPLATEENLREVIAFEMDRQTPFTVDKVYFSHRVAGRDKVAQQIIVDLTVVPRSVVMTALAVAARVGLTPETVTIADAMQGNSGNLLPRAGRRRWPARRRLLSGVLAAAVALTATAGFFRVEQSHQTARALEQDVAAAKQDADAAVRLRTEIARVGAAAQFLVNRKHKVPSVSLLLLELTRILPDEAFLTDLQLTGNDVQLAGSAASATNLIERLNHAAMFADAGFRSPVVRDPRLDRETFNISMRLVAGPAR